MAFESTKTTTMQKADTVSMEAELSRVGLKLELAKEALATYKDLTDEIETARTELKEMEKELAKGAKIIAENSKKIAEQKNEADKMEKEIADNQAKINAQQMDIDFNTDKVSENLKEKTKSEKDLQAIKAEIIPLEKKAEMLKFAEKTEKERIRKDLEILNDEVSGLKEEKEVLENSLSRINQNIETNKQILFKQEDDIKIYNGNKIDLEKELEKQRAEMTTAMEIHTKKIASDNAEITKQCGELSVKMAWLSEKTEILKNAKSALEKKFNTKIDLIL